MHLPTLLTSLSLLATSFHAAAQESEAVPITYRLTAFGTGTLDSPTYANTRAGDPIRISKMHVTNPIEAKLREGGFLDFFGEEAAAEDPPAFSVKIPASAVGSDLLVVLMFSAQEMKPVLLDLKALGLQRGGQFVFNLLPMAIAVQCGENTQPLFIQPGKTRNVPAPAEDKVIQTLFYSDENGKPLKFSSSIFFKDKESRQIVFCYGEQGAKLPKVAPISIYDPKMPDPVE